MGRNGANGENSTAYSEVSFEKVASGLPTIRALSKHLISNELLTKEFRRERRVTLFPRRRFPPQLVCEVQQKRQMRDRLLAVLFVHDERREPLAVRR